MLQEDRDRRYFEEYVATHVWMIAAAEYARSGQELRTPVYYEIMHPETVDSRSADEIKNDLLKKLQQ